MKYKYAVIYKNIKDFTKDEMILLLSRLIDRHHDIKTILRICNEYNNTHLDNIFIYIDTDSVKLVPTQP